MLPTLLNIQLKFVMKHFDFENDIQNQYERMEIGHSW